MKIKNISINFGPQHPAAHGVLRLIIHLKGELIEYVDPHIGLLHRGTEKLIEQKTFLQAIPYMDRLDYVSTLAQEHTFVLSVEKHLDINISKENSIIRIILLELTRLQNHIMAITTHALDLGALSPFLWGFEEREKIMEIFERISGARLHCNLFRPGGFSLLPDFYIFSDILEFCNKFLIRIDEIENLLSFNKIWMQRLKLVGVISKNFSKSFGFSGVLLRSTGIPFDLRERLPYEFYNNINWNIFCSKNGDCFDRYLLRINEMRESLKIIKQCINFLNKLNKKFNWINQEHPKKLMENMITHFLYYSSNNQIINSNINYTSTESPKGEFGILLITTYTQKNPIRCRIRAPGFFHLQAINKMSQKYFLADIVAIIGTLDIVFGEIDR